MSADTNEPTNEPDIRQWAEPDPIGCGYLIPLKSKARSQAIWDEVKARLND